MNEKGQKIIYVADDDKGIVEAMRFLLEDAGYEVRSAHDGEVVGMIKNRRPDLLLLDIWMSGTDGREICALLKENSATSGVPIIMVSANPDTRTISKTCGADDYISKPFEVQALLDKIEMHTSSQSSLEQEAG